jgi:hypothetical protein
MVIWTEQVWFVTRYYSIKISILVINIILVTIIIIIIIIFVVRASRTITKKDSQL